MSTMNPNEVIGLITLQAAQAVIPIPFREYSSKRKALVDAANEVFEKGESRLEELSRASGLNRERNYVFSQMETYILRLLLFDLKHEAYVFALRYVRNQQQYEEDKTH